AVAQQEPPPLHREAPRPAPRTPRRSKGCSIHGSTGRHPRTRRPPHRPGRIPDQQAQGDAIMSMGAQPREGYLNIRQQPTHQIRLQYAIASLKYHGNLDASIAEFDQWLEAHVEKVRNAED